MLSSAGYPPDGARTLEINVLWNGLFHASTYAFTAAGLYLLWRYGRQEHVPWSGKLLRGAVLIGFGLFNLVEGVISHHWLGIHHVNETVPREQWVHWEVGFLVWGAMLLGGLLFSGAGLTAPFDRRRPRRDFAQGRSEKPERCSRLSRPSWIALATRMPATPRSASAHKSSGPRRPPAA